MAVHVDSIITSSLSILSTIQAMSTSSSPTIEPRIQHSVIMFEEIQTRLDEERRLREEAERARDEGRARIEARNVQMQSLQLMVANLYALHGKPVPDLPISSLNVLNPSQGSNNVPVATSGVGQASPMTPRDGPTPITKTM
ncbi:hypothetical protein ACQJBY_005078 [Aegilops geniculata]